MAHDGSAPMTETPVLTDLLATTSAAIAPAEAFLAHAKEVVRKRVSSDGKVKPALLEAEQTAAHGLAWVATYVEALRQMQGWAERLDAEGKFGEVEQLLHQIRFR